MTGGQFGAYGYLNYLKKNIHPSSLKGPKALIIEFKDGRTTQYNKQSKHHKRYTRPSLGFMTNRVIDFSAVENVSLPSCIKN
jgi:hypothetical protein